MEPDEIETVVQKVGHMGDDNRAGLERTLHRISVIRNRAGVPVGLTCRVGRAVFGSVRLIHDLIETGESVLLLGRPGVGKTTMLREVARVLADDFDKRVVVVDTSNEIAGDGNMPHPAIGHARRMQVPNTDLQHKIMIEAVENHTPEVIVIDEMSTEMEVLAARTIAERGVQLVATAHGNTLSNVISNPTLADLIGGTQTVTLGDIEARRRGTQKTVLERRHDPTFTIVVEIRERNQVAIHRNVRIAVDCMLRTIELPIQVRTLNNDGSINERHELHSSLEDDFKVAGFDIQEIKRMPFPDSIKKNSPMQNEGYNQNGYIQTNKLTPIKVHPFGVSKMLIKDMIDEMNVPVTIVDFTDDADVFITTKSHYSRRPTQVRKAERDGLPVHVLRRATKEQVKEFLTKFYTVSTENITKDNSVRSAMQETEFAIEKIMAGERKIQLSPQAAYIRRLQHGLAERHSLGSSSAGKDPSRRVVIRRRKR